MTIDNSHNDQSNQQGELTEDRIREIAREEAQIVHNIEVQDGDGETWSLSKLVHTFEIPRRTALKAMGLMAVGSSATVAVLKAMTETAEASTGSAGTIGTDADRPTIYGDDVDANSVSTESLVTFSGFQDVSGSRSLDSWHQNTTGSDILVTYVFEPFNETDATSAVAHVNDSQTDNAVHEWAEASGQLSASTRRTIQFVVPKSYYYKIANPDNNLITTRWWEQQ